MLLLWGNNYDYQVGDCGWSDNADDENCINSEPDEILEPTPCRTFANRRVSNVSCGSRHTLATTDDGVAWSWGWGSRGQLGHGSHDRCSKPTEIKALNNNQHCNFVSQISAGGTHSGCILKDGSVYMWGDFTYGQLGIEKGVGGPDGSVNTPRQVHLTMNKPLYAKKLSLGGMHTAAIMEDDRVVCFGRADSGQLGIGSDWVMDSYNTVMGVFSPQVVSGALEGLKITYISCGAFHTACCSADGSAFTWGKEDFGALGCSNDGLLRGGLMVPLQIRVGTPEIRSSSLTRDVFIRSSSIACAIECGGWHTIALDENGVLWACGRGEFGRLGVGDEQSRRELVKLPAWSSSSQYSLHPVKSISLGGSHSLALFEDGSVYTWGRASNGRLGVKTDASCITKPTHVLIRSDSSNYKAISVSAGGSHNAAIVVKEDQSSRC